MRRYNQIDHILVDRRWHSSIPDLRSFRRADCNNDHYPLVAKVREELAVSKQAAQQHNLPEVKISNRFAALENLGDSEDINRVWENIKENITISAIDTLGLYELNRHKS